MMRLRMLLVFGLICLLNCKQPNVPDIPSPAAGADNANSLSISSEEYRDKILGALVGSAIGDAMGASTEMWHRSDIQHKYGFITGLTPATRDKSPEGTWDHNMVQGATTDDTRWKYFFGEYLITYPGQANKEKFADYIVAYYQSLIKAIPDKDIETNTDLLDQEMDKVNWIKEWARVALAYQEGPEAYQLAQHRFYGGEMSCAGMLYGPMFGMVSRSGKEAYTTGYEHALFDLGYARDITALTATMTNYAIQNWSVDSIMAEAFLVDPMGYKESRLIGRLAVNMALEAISLVESKAEMKVSGQTEIAMPTNYNGTLEAWQKLTTIYNELEKRQKAIPFHAGEIWQILIAGLKYGDGDFLRTMQFIVNYGRDNDTVAAIAGMILGAKIGYEDLPDKEKTEVLKVTKNIMGIDLEALANELSTSYQFVLR